MGFKNFLREYFTFNRRERNGVFILLSIILLLILYLSFSDYFLPVENTDFYRFEKDIALFEASLKQSKDSIYAPPKEAPPTNSSDAISSDFFFFNPNNLPGKDWKRLGLSDKQIKVIKNYENKGGKFRTKEDVKKMYCITLKEYSSIEAYIQIPQEESDKKIIKDSHSLKKEPTVKMVELNSADTLELDKLKGIGFAYAKRIIKYRELLGGFVSKEQLMEVYGFDKEKYDALSSAVFVDDSKVKKININSVVFEELKKHPYAKYNIANLILYYRKQHGNYKSVEDIKQLDLMTDELFSKISPYLTVE